jgi:SpoVK/Ycf46/Vps4 family AAA+-type ATPase
MVYNLCKQNFEQEDKDAVIKRVCICAAEIDATEDLFADVIEIVRYLNNETLEPPKFYTRAGVENFGNLVIKKEGKEEHIQEKGKIRQRENAVETFFDYMAAGYPVVLVDTLEEQEAIGVIREASGNLMGDDRKIYLWDVRHNLRNVETNINRMENVDLESVLNTIIDEIGGERTNNIFIFRTVEDYMKDSAILGKFKILKEAIQSQTTGHTFVFILGRNLEIDIAYEKVFYLDESIGYPDVDKIESMITDFAGEKKCEIDTELMNEMITKCKGLTQDEIGRVLNLAFVKSTQNGNGRDTGIFDDNKVLDLIHREKKQIIKKSSLVEIVDIEDDMVNVQGLENLMDWLNVRKKIINNSIKADRNHVDSPRGVLLTGMPGCGKSLCAKNAAKLFRVPLLKLDMGSLMNKYQGESEHNFREALKLAEAISPCVLWIDELEKAFGGNNEDNSHSESSSRILGYLLTWMQEKKSMTFIMATSNDVKKLPPELLRKGRFDDLFFVDLPNEKERASILEAHLAKKGISFDDYTTIARKTKDYSGAEIEAVVKAVVEKRFINILDNENKAGSGFVDETMFLTAIEETPPLSQTMNKELEEMKKFCESRKFRMASR